MQYVAAVVPFLVIGLIAALIVSTALRRRTAGVRPARAARVQRTARRQTTRSVPLRVVSPDQMDAELQDLIRKG